MPCGHVLAHVFNMKHLKKADRCISRNIVNITIKNKNNSPNTLRDENYQASSHIYIGNSLLLLIMILTCAAGRIASVQ